MSYETLNSLSSYNGLTKIILPKKDCLKIQIVGHSWNVGLCQTKCQWCTAMLVGYNDKYGGDRLSLNFFKM